MHVALMTASQRPYLAALLAASPERLKVHAAIGRVRGPAALADAVMFEVQHVRDLPADWSQRSARLGRPAVLVVSREPPAGDEWLALLRAGVDDVLTFADLNATALAAALRKAVARAGARHAARVRANPRPMGLRHSGIRDRAPRAPLRARATAAAHPASHAQPPSGANPSTRASVPAPNMMRRRRFGGLGGRSRRNAAGHVQQS